MNHDRGTVLRLADERLIRNIIGTGSGIFLQPIRLCVCDMIRQVQHKFGLKGYIVLESCMDECIRIAVRECNAFEYKSMHRSINRGCRDFYAASGNDEIFAGRCVDSYSCTCANNMFEFFSL